MQSKIAYILNLKKHDICHPCRNYDAEFVTPFKALLPFVK